MSEPCSQAGNIGGLKAEVGTIKDALEKLSEGQERFISILERIAQQGEKIHTLEQGQNLLFMRVRDIEIKAEGERGKTGAIMAGVSVVTSAVTASVAKFFWR